MNHVDTSKTVTHLSLCTGYAGIDLGLKIVVPSLRTVAYCEREGFACANLVAKIEAGYLDAAPIWTDLRTFGWEAFRGKVDILSGGYPCQPFSLSGKRRGKEDPRHLWPFIADGIAIVQPAIIFLENVDGHVSLGLREVLTDLVNLGYRVEGRGKEPTWGLFTSEEIGAPHRRTRVFIVAYRNESGLEGLLRYVRKQRESRWFFEDPVGQTPLSCLPSGSGTVAYCGMPRSEAWVSEATKSPRWKSGKPDYCSPQDGSGTLAHGHGSREPQQGGSIGELGGRVIDCGEDGGSQTVANSETWMPGEPTEREGGQSVGRGSEDGGSPQLIAVPRPARPGMLQYPWEPPRVVAYTRVNHGRRGSPRFGRGSGSTVHDPARDEGVPTKSPVDGDPARDTDRLDPTHLHCAVDNRADELRLIGNGVDPVTAAKAFLTLLRRV